MWSRATGATRQELHPIGALVLRLGAPALAAVGGERPNALAIAWSRSPVACW